MINDSNVPKHFWDEAIRTAAYILNRSPSVNSVTPAEFWYDRKPDVSNLRVFGSIAYSHVPEQFRDKFDKKSEICIMIGYTPNGYRLWNVEKEKIQISRNVVFNEKLFYYKMNKKMTISIEDCSSAKGKENIVKEDWRYENEKEEIENDDLQSKIKEQLDIRDKKRNKRIPKKFDDYEMYMAFDALSYVERA